MNKVATKQAKDVSVYQGSKEDDAEDLKIPRVKLVQKQSQEMDDSDLNLKPGSLIHSISKEEFTQPLLFVPIVKNVFYIRYNPIDKEKAGFDPSYEAGAMIYNCKTKEECWKNSEGVSDAEWSNNKPPLAQRVLNFLSYLPEYPGIPFIIGFSKTSLDAGKDVTSMLKFSKNKQFTLKAVSMEKGGNKYHVLKVQGAGELSNDIVDICDKIYKEVAPNVQEELNAENPKWEE